MDNERNLLAENMKQFGIRVMDVKRQTDELGLKDGQKGFSYSMVHSVLISRVREQDSIRELAINMVKKARQKRAKIDSELSALQEA